MEKTLRDLQNEVDKLIEKIGDYWKPLSMLAALVEEIGEVARIINCFEGEKREKKGERIKELSMELGDALFALICIANYFKVNLSNALEETIEKYEERDFNRFKD